MLALQGSTLIRVVADGEDVETEDIADLSAVGLGSGGVFASTAITDEGLWLGAPAGQLTLTDLEEGTVARSVDLGGAGFVNSLDFDAGRLWLLQGTPYVDAVIVSVDVATGEVQRFEPPEGAQFVAVGAGDGAVWAIGGDPETTAAIARLDPASGEVIEVHNVGLVAKTIAVGAGGVWVGGDLFIEEGAGAGLAHVDPATGDVVERIPLGAISSDVVVLDGAVWVSDALGSDSGPYEATLRRIDPATDTVTLEVGVGDGSAGSMEILVAPGYLVATNVEDGRRYLVNAASGEIESAISGGAPFIALW
ncbi:MAG: hypothetical protein GEU80_10825 [Dehalococcoidia bacterium]|nr:hypothetical protein [Dehalococcoidia bacterium]